MNANDPLTQLRDIHMPQAISWWPLAPGWWLLIGLFCCATLWIATILIKRYRASRYRRQALAQLKQLEQSEQRGGENQLAAIFATLKQTAISAYPQSNFTSLSMGEFMHFLQCSCNQGVFDSDPEAIELALYAHNPDPDQQLTEQIMHSAKIWVSKHTVDSKLGYQC